MRRFATHRLDAISPDDLAALVRELRADGLAESTIVIVVGVANRIYRYAARRLGWVGTNPVSLLLPSERPKPGQSAKRRLFERGRARADDRRRRRAVRHAVHAGGVHRRSCLRAARDSGGRTSASRTWRMPRWSSPARSIAMATSGPRRRTAPREPSRSPVSWQRFSAATRSARSSPDREDFVFCTCTGRPLGQRNVARALRKAQQNAVDRDGVRLSRYCTSATSSASRSRCRTAPCRRCIASATRSPVGRCSRARASTRSRSCLATATPT